MDTITDNDESLVDESSLNSTISTKSDISSKGTAKNTIAYALCIIHYSF